MLAGSLAGGERVVQGGAGDGEAVWRKRREVEAWVAADQQIRNDLASDCISWETDGRNGWQ